MTSVMKHLHKYMVARYYIQKRSITTEAMIGNIMQLWLMLCWRAGGTECRVQSSFISVTKSRYIYTPKYIYNQSIRRRGCSSSRHLGGGGNRISGSGVSAGGD